MQITIVPSKVRDYSVINIAVSQTRKYQRKIMLLFVLYYHRLFSSGAQGRSPIEKSYRNNHYFIACNILVGEFLQHRFH